jgi:hypothetical protein
MVRDGHRVAAPCFHFIPPLDPLRIECGVHCACVKTEDARWSGVGQYFTRRQCKFTA